MMEQLDAILENSAALGVFVFVLAGILLCFLVAAVLVAWIGAASIRYAVRRIRRWFVEEVLIPKARADYNAMRGVDK